MDFLSALSGFFSWILQWIPRIGICRATHGGVKFRKGKELERIEPGLYWYWPVFTEIEVEPVARQPISAPIQTLTTRDGVSVSIRPVVSYEIRDTVSFFGRSWDGTEIVADFVSAACGREVTRRTLAELQQDMGGDLQETIAERARKDLRRFGAYVLEVRISDYAQVNKVFRLIGDQDFVEDDNG